MPNPADKLAHSLRMLKELQDRGAKAIRSDSMTRTHRERLQRSGFIPEVMKGWYVPARTDESPGESTAPHSNRQYFPDPLCFEIQSRKLNALP